MKKTICKLVLSLVVGSSLLASSTQALNSGGLFDWCNFGGCWEAGAGVLWQQHCISNWTVADGIAFMSPREGLALTHKTFDVKPQFYWGFKVWGGWYSSDGCHFVNLTYKHLWSSNNNKNFPRSPICSS